jgi:hypothetical protein
MKEVT